MGEEREVITTEPAATEEVVRTDQEVVATDPTTVAERRPVQQTVVSNDDAVGTSWAASQMIQTVVWAVVVLVLLGVALWALHVYAGLF